MFAYGRGGEMTLSQLLMWCNGIVPEADETVIPSSSSTLLSKLNILNEGAKEFALLTRCFPREKKFTVTANNYTYSLSSNVPDSWKCGRRYLASL